jgi:hypothetical protein
MKLKDEYISIFAEVVSVEKCCCNRFLASMFLPFMCIKQSLTCAWIIHSECGSVVTAVLFRGRFTVNESPQLNVQQIS